jgi:hypothetical protein
MFHLTKDTHAVFTEKHLNRIIYKLDLGIKSHPKPKTLTTAKAALPEL